MSDNLKLFESEVRSIVRSEISLLSERAGSGLQLSILVGDAMVEGLRDLVSSASQNIAVQKAVAASGQADPRQLAQQVVSGILSDQDFMTDVTSLVAAAIKRSARG